MPVVDPALIDLPLAAALGLAFGLGPCLFACLPFLAPVFLATDGGVRRSWRILLPHALGRLTAYGGLGFAAGHAGRIAATVAGDATLRWLLGMAALMLGFALLLRRRRGCGGRHAEGMAPLVRRDAADRGLMPGGLYLLGLGTALSPCAPLGAVLLAAALAADALHGLTLGLSFGLGAVCAPSLVFGLGLAYVGGRLRERLGAWRPRIEALSAGLLILAGAGQLGHLA